MPRSWPVTSGDYPRTKSTARCNIEVPEVLRDCGRRRPYKITRIWRHTKLSPPLTLGLGCRKGPPSVSRVCTERCPTMPRRFSFGLRHSTCWQKSAVGRMRLEGNGRQWWLRENEPLGRGQRRGTVVQQWGTRHWLNGFGRLGSLSANSGREWTGSVLRRRWLARSHGGMTYRLTQLLTGHGCSNAFFHSISRV